MKKHRIAICYGLAYGGGTAAIICMALGLPLIAAAQGAVAAAAFAAGMWLQRAARRASQIKVYRAGSGRMDTLIERFFDEEEVP